MLISLTATEQLLELFDTSILPNTTNQFDTFQFKSQSNNIKVNMIVNCSPSIRKSGLYYSKYNLCDYEFTNENIDDVNTILHGLQLNKLETLKFDNDSIVEYVFELMVGSKASPITGKAVQRFKLLDEIPITQTLYKISRDGLATTHINLKLLEFDAGYLRNSNVQNFKLEFYNDDLPKWLKHEVRTDGVYIIGEFPDDTIRSSICSFSLVDKITQLKSRSLELYIEGLPGFLFDRSQAVIFYSIFLLCILIYLIYLLVKVITGSIDINPKSPIEAVQDTDNTSTILTHSILQWKNGSKNDLEYLRSTQDFTHFDDKIDDTINFSDKSRIVEKESIKTDESLMYEIEQFSVIVKNEKVEIMTSGQGNVFNQMHN